MRSGTNWAGSLLNLHPCVLCRGEFHFQRLYAGVQNFAELRNYDGGDQSKQLIRGRFESGLRDVVRSCIAGTASLKPGATHLGDRSPEALTDQYGPYPTIYIVRDGRDVLVSWMFHLLTHGSQNADDAFLRHQADFARSPRSFVDEPSKALSLVDWTRIGIKKWCERVRADHDLILKRHDQGGDAPVFLIRYEDLHADTDHWRRKMYAFLGVDSDAASPVSQESNTAAGFNRGEQPDSFYRSGQIGDWKKYFTPLTSELFKEECGDLLVRLGYETDSSW